MQTILSGSKEFTPEFEVAVAAYRYKIFIERLGWQLPVQDGLERDQFDRPETVYVVARDDKGDICGCARLLPTTAPYLLGEVFPQLMNGLPVPAAHDVWELSRFAAVDVGPTLSTPQATARISRELLAAAVVVAAEHGASRMITVTTLGVERLMLRGGIHVHRTGPPLYVDNQPILAFWIEIDAQTTNALGINLDKVRFPVLSH
jgi:acyl homoserine lactone synthase